MSPFDDLPKGRQFARREQTFGKLAFEFQAAEIIVSAFEVGGADRPFEDGFEQRDVALTHEPEHDRPAFFAQLGAGREE